MNVFNVLAFITEVSDAKVNVEKYFSDLLSKDQSLSAGVAAIKTLLMVLEKTKCKSYFLADFSNFTIIYCDYSKYRARIEYGDTNGS